MLKSGSETIYLRSIIYKSFPIGHLDHDEAMEAGGCEFDLRPRDTTVVG